MKEELLHGIGKGVLGCYSLLFLDLSIQKKSYLPDGPKLYAANHPTTTDPFLIGLLSREPINVLVTGTAFEVPGFRTYLAQSGHIPVIRNQGRGNDTVKRAVSRLGSGKSIAIFPEGALSPETEDGYGVGAPHSGVGRIALDSGAPVIPVGIAPTRAGVIGKGYELSSEIANARWAVKGTYAMTVGYPLYFRGDSGDWDQVQYVSERITGEIRRLTHMSQARVKENNGKDSTMEKIIEFIEFINLNKDWIYIYFKRWMQEFGFYRS
ncbi:MAG: lysophospholipid acyltransferase family protein [Anaerolineales bacterium]